MTDIEAGHSSTLGRLLAEAKRRHVFRTAGLYAGAAFAILQTADIALPALGLNEDIISYLLLIIALGFPLALIGAWFFDLSSDGIQVTEETPPERRLTGVRVIDGVVVLLALGVGFMYLERFVDEPPELQGVETSADKPEVAGLAPALLEPSIAVLPFENLSDSKENAYFAAGIHEDILNDLSKVGELIVTSRTSTLAYAGSTKPVPVIAEELGVNYIIEGSVRRAGEQVRISVQLIEAVTDKHIWSEAYDRTVLNVFEVQREVAREVSHALRVQFDIGLAAGESPTRSLEAYELFLEARSLANTFEPDNVAEAVANYRKALEIDPEYIDAWSGLSLALNSTLLFGKSDRQSEEARLAAEKALELSPDSWMANYAKAVAIGFNGLGEPAMSLPFFAKAVAINPNDGNLLSDYGFNLWFSGDARSAMAQFLGAYRRNPLSANANMSRAMVAFFEGDNLTAEKFIRRAIEIDPNSTYIHWWAGAAFNSMNNPEAAARQFARVLAIDRTHLAATFWLATVFTILGDYDAADYWLDSAEMIAPTSPQYFIRRANNYALGGETQAYQDHINEWLRVDPGNSDALRYRAFATARAVRQAFEDENQREFHRLSRLALSHSIEMLQPVSPAGNRYIVNFVDSWQILAAAVHAKNLGESDLLQSLALSLIEFHESQPPGSFATRNMQMMMAYSLLGDNTSALAHASNMRADKVRSVWMLSASSFDVISDAYGVFGGINKDLAFQTLVAEMQAANDESLQRLRNDTPHIFPPED